MDGFGAEGCVILSAFLWPIRAAGRLSVRPRRTDSRAVNVICQRTAMQTLPRAASASGVCHLANRRAAERWAMNPSLPRKNILIVDDSEMTRQGLSRAAKDAGFNGISVANGQ